MKQPVQSVNLKVPGIKAGMLLSFHMLSTSNQTDALPQHLVRHVPPDSGLQHLSSSALQSKRMGSARGACDVFNQLAEHCLH